MNKKEENKFFNVPEQTSNANYSKVKKDIKEFKYNSEVLPPLKKRFSKNKTKNKFYINIKFPFFKLVIGVLCIILIILIIINLPYHKLSIVGDKYCLVIFDSNEIYSERIKCGSDIERIEDPVKDDLEFDGWYLEDELYDFSNPVNSNITLVAKWKTEEVLEKKNE